jgi:hypothetical protein
MSEESNNSDSKPAVRQAFVVTATLAGEVLAESEEEAKELALNYLDRAGDYTHWMIEDIEFEMQ